MMRIDDIEQLYSLASPWISAQEIPELDTLLEYGQKKIFQKGEIIFTIGDVLDNFYILKQGRIKITQQTRNGEEKIFWFMNGPGILGDVPFFNQHPSMAIASAAKESIIYAFDRQTMYQVIAQHPQLTFYLFRLLSQKIRILAFKIEDMNFNDPVMRLAKLLLILSQQNGQTDEENKCIIPVKITHQEIADLTGLHRVTATNALKKLNELGLVVKYRDKILISNLQKLYEWITNNEKK